MHDDEDHLRGILSGAGSATSLTAGSLTGTGATPTIADNLGANLYPVRTAPTAGT